MAIAYQTRSAIYPSPTHTQSSLFDGFKSGLETSGMAFIKEYTASSIRYGVFSKTAGTGTYSTNYYRFGITTGLTANHQIGSGFNSTTNTLIEGSGDTFSTTFNATTPISLISLNGDNVGSEFSLLCILQGVTFQMLGMKIPVNTFEDLWDLDSDPRGLIAQSSSLVNWSASSRNPFGNSTYEALPIGNVRLTSLSTRWSTAFLQRGINFYNHSNQGCALWSSEHWGICPGLTQRLQNFQEPGTGELLLQIGSGAGALYVKVANSG